ncbi:efflux RND transporter periplasmic adaptor subunit, partial [Jiangella asiatica]|uniref:efflux RND transporter periplasmic adaptor subunit n=1 Tax=Jiangella asiatica TaxID=2530372 RepID=UPI0013A5E058
MLVAAVAVAGGAWAVTREEPAAEASSTIVEATVGTFSETVTSTGTFQPAQTAELAFAVSGEVTSVLVEEGDVVEAGQELATVDTVTLDAELTAAEAGLDAALEQLDSDTEAGAADTQLAADEATVAAAESRVALAEEALDNATLRSTIAGTVASVDLAVGDDVTGGSSGSGSTGSTGSTGTSAGSDTSTTTSSAQVTVMTTDTFVVETSVGSADLGRLEEGLQAELTPSGTTDTVYGTVSSVGLVASSSSSGTATFPVEIEVTGQVEGLYAGGSADVTIIVSQRTDVLTVPTAALSTTEDGATTVTVEVDDGSHVETTVEIGASFGVQTEIVSGLAEGDQVVVTTAVPGRGGGDDGGGSPEEGELPGGRVPGGG